MTKDCSLISLKNTSSEHDVYKYCFKRQNKNNKQHVLNLYFSGNSINNLLSYCGLTDARRRASEKDLSVTKSLKSDFKLCTVKNVLITVTLQSIKKREKICES